MRRPPPVSTLFPYTTLFRSVACENVADRRIVRVLHPTPHGAGRHIELDLTGRHHPVEHDRVTEARGPQLQTLDLQHITEVMEGQDNRADIYHTTLLLRHIDDLPKRREAVEQKMRNLHDG